MENTPAAAPPIQMTTADLRAFALQQLADMQAHTTRWHAVASALPGDERGVRMAQMIDRAADRAGDVMLLAKFAARLGDEATYKAINLAWVAFVRIANHQAQECRTASIPSLHDARMVEPLKPVDLSTAPVPVFYGRSQ